MRVCVCVSAVATRLTIHLLLCNTGTVISGVDFGLTDGQKFFDPDVVYLLQTSDACEILVREKGHAPNVVMLFETSCSQYNYLNGVVAYGLAAPIQGGVSAQVFSVCCSLFFVPCSLLFLDFTIAPSPLPPLLSGDTFVCVCVFVSS